MAAIAPVILAQATPTQEALRPRIVMLGVDRQCLLGDSASLDFPGVPGFKPYGLQFDHDLSALYEINSIVIGQKSVFSVTEAQMSVALLLVDFTAVFLSAESGDGLSLVVVNMGDARELSSFQGVLYYKRDDL